MQTTARFIPQPVPDLLNAPDLPERINKVTAKPSCEPYFPEPTYSKSTAQRGNLSKNISQEILVAVERLQSDIEAIEARNKKVEADKAWERSLVRISTLGAIIYSTSAVVMHCLGSKNCFLDALVPVVGFYISSQSLPQLKSWYMQRFNSKLKVKE